MLLKQLTKLKMIYRKHLKLLIFYNFWINLIGVLYRKKYICILLFITSLYSFNYEEKIKISSFYDYTNLESKFELTYNFQNYNNKKREYYSFQSSIFS